MKKLAIAVIAVLVAVLVGVLVYFVIPKEKPVDLEVSLEDVTVEVGESAEIKWWTSIEDALIVFSTSNEKVAKITQMSEKNCVTGVKIGEAELMLFAKYNGVKQTAKAKVMVVDKTELEVPNQPNETPTEPEENPNVPEENKPGQEPSDQPSGEDPETPPTSEPGETPEESPTDPEQGGEGVPEETPGGNEGNTSAPNPEGGNGEDNQGSGDTPNEPGEGTDDTNPDEEVASLNITAKKNCSIEGKNVVVNVGASFCIIQILLEENETKPVFDYNEAYINIEAYSMLGAGVYKISITEAGEYLIKVSIDGKIYEFTVVVK